MILLFSLLTLFSFNAFSDIGITSFRDDNPVSLYCNYEYKDENHDIKQSVEIFSDLIILNDKSRNFFAVIKDVYFELQEGHSLPYIFSIHTEFFYLDNPFYIPSNSTINGLFLTDGNKIEFNYVYNNLNLSDGLHYNRTLTSFPCEKKTVFTDLEIWQLAI